MTPFRNIGYRPCFPLSPLPENWMVSPTNTSWLRGWPSVFYSAAFNLSGSFVAFTLVPFTHSSGHLFHSFYSSEGIWSAMQGRPVYVMVSCMLRPCSLSDIPTGRLNAGEQQRALHLHRRKSAWPPEVTEFWRWAIIVWLFIELIRT